MSLYGVNNCGCAFCLRQAASKSAIAVQELFIVDVPVEYEVAGDCVPTTRSPAHQVDMVTVNVTVPGAYTFPDPADIYQLMLETAYTRITELEAKLAVPDDLTSRIRAGAMALAKGRDPQALYPRPEEVDAAAVVLCAIYNSREADAARMTLYDTVSGCADDSPVQQPDGRVVKPIPRNALK